MNSTDKRLKKQDLDLIKKLTGKEIIKIVHDEYIYTNTSFGHINIFLNDDIYELKCAITPTEYFGSKEDVGILKFNKVTINDVKSELKDHKQTEDKISNKLLKIDIVNEHQYVNDNKNEYSYDYTKGIILYFEGFEYAFKMSAWFSEIIEIYKGYNLIEKFNNDDDFNDSFSNIKNKNIKREVVTV